MTPKTSTSTTRRRAAESALARSPLQRVAWARSRRRLCVLAYHGVPHAGRFGAQLDWLTTHTTPVSLTEVHAAVLHGVGLPEHAVLLTFDDGERSVLEIAAPLLRERGVPAVAFVVAGLIGTDQPFWWTEVEALVGPPQAPGLVRRLKRLPDSERRNTLDRLRARAATTVRTPQLTGDELRKLELDGVAVGNHSLTHPCLDTCADDAVRREVLDAHDRLTDLLGHPPEAFAYPNGNWDGRVRRVVSSAGYPLAFAFDHRLVTLPVDDPLTVSRIRVDACAGVDRLRLLVSGLHSAQHRLRRLP